jgi:uncharacterized protein (DUF1501 family)
VPAGNVVQLGPDSSGRLLGLHPRLSGFRSIFDAGHLALIQRTGYANSSRSHFLGTDIWSTANPNATQGTGWLGRYLDALPSPVDPLVAWNTTRETPHSLQTRIVGVPAIPDPQGYAFASPNAGDEATLERTASTAIASHVPIDQPHVAFVNGTLRAALTTLDRVASVAQYTPAVTYPNNGFGLALKAVAGAIAKEIGTKVFWVQTGGYDTHSAQNVNTANGAYASLMATLNDGLTAFYTDLNNQGLMRDTLVLQFSEFGRRIAEYGSAGTDHGAAGVMMVMGGSVRGGIYGTAPSLNPVGDNPTLENAGNDVRFETDFRSVYARVIDNWLGANSTTVLGGDFRKSSLSFL